MRDYEARVSYQSCLEAKDKIMSVRKSWQFLPEDERHEVAPIGARIQEAEKIITECMSALKAIETTLLHKPA
jgi:hypothetical protein